MLRNECSCLNGTVIAFLNEVLSLNAQECDNSVTRLKHATVSSMKS